MFKFSRRWLVTFVTLLLFSSMTAQAMTPSECGQFQLQDDDTQFDNLVKAQEEFITSLRLDLHGTKFRQVMKDGTEVKRYLELPLSAFPDAVKTRYPELAGEIPALIDSQNAVESVARCFMYGRTSDSDPEVLRWRYYRLGETDKPLVGFTIPDPEAKVGEDEKVPETGYVTEPDHCRQGACDFRTIPLAEIDRDAVRLVYHLKHEPIIIDRDPDAPLSADGVTLPKYTHLTRLTLKRKEEIFTSPEIYFLVLYFKDGKFIRMDTVDIDWATEKGVNEGDTELMFWKGADDVRLVLKERDLKIPFSKLLKLTFDVVRIGTQLVGIDAPWLDIVSNGVINAIPEGEEIEEVNPRDVTMPGELKHYQKATYMDDTRIKRREVNSEDEKDFPMHRGTRMKLKSILYTYTRRHGDTVAAPEPAAVTVDERTDSYLPREGL